MDRAALLSALLAVAACGGAQPDFETALGAQVFLNGHDDFLTVEQANEMEAWLVESIPLAGYDARRARACVASAVVRVVGEGYRCWGDRPCAGEQRGELLIVVDTGCAYTSAYIHELAHWLQQCVKDRYDPSHLEQAVWSLVRSYPKRCKR